MRFGQKGISYLNTDDRRTIRYPDPKIKANDTIKLDLEINKITDFVQFDVGNVVLVTGGRNRDRVESLRAGRSIREALRLFTFRMPLVMSLRPGYVFTVGKGHKAMGLSPQGQGYKIVNH